MSFYKIIFLNLIIALPSCFLIFLMKIFFFTEMNWWVILSPIWLAIIFQFAIIIYYFIVVFIEKDF